MSRERELRKTLAQMKGYPAKSPAGLGSKRRASREMEVALNRLLDPDSAPKPKCCGAPMICGAMCVVEE